jgi:hypothetical protein
MRTEEAVTEVPGQFAAFGGFTVLYLLLSTILIWLLLRLAKSPPPVHLPVPYETERFRRNEVPDAVG